MKVFGIGLSRTGTSSLNSALINLGFKSIHYPPLKHIFELMKTYDASTDTPVALMYKELDKKFPNSKFILTIREPDNWLKSCSWFFSKDKAIKDAKRKNRQNLLNEQQITIRTSLYGSEFFDEELYLKGFLSHNKEVKEYFKDRPNDLLIIKISNDSYKDLCPFLGRKRIRKKFPHLHNRGVRNTST